MTFTSICPTNAVSEGGMGLFQAGKKSVLLVWPTGGELKAYRGRCPHADVPLTGATFNGKGRHLPAPPVGLRQHQRQMCDAPRAQRASSV